MIVGQQDPALNVAPIVPGIMDQPAQRKIGADGIEQGKRIGLALFTLPQAVREFVADRGKPGRWEMVRKLARGNVRAGGLLRPLDDVWIGDFLSADARLDARAIFRHERVELL